MQSSKQFKKMMKSAEGDFTFRLETIILDITEQIVKAMEERGINRSKLAQLSSVSPAAVTKILNGSSNFTLKKLLSLADALGLELHVSLRTKESAIRRPSLVSSAEVDIPDLRARAAFFSSAKDSEYQGAWKRGRPAFKEAA